MPWSKLDDKMYDHPKIIAAGPLAMALWVSAINYSSSQLSDGFVPTVKLRQLWDFSAFPGVTAETLTTHLIALRVPGCAGGLFDAAEGGIRIHDYLDYNPSRAQVLRKRTRDLHRKQGRDDSATIPRRIAADSATIPPVPDPTRPDPQELVGTRVRAHGQSLDPWQTKLDAIWAARTGGHLAVEALRRLVDRTSEYPPPAVVAHWEIYCHATENPMDPQHMGVDHFVGRFAWYAPDNTERLKKGTTHGQPSRSRTVTTDDDAWAAEATATQGRRPALRAVVPTKPPRQRAVPGGGTAGE